jgi:hypothetical protein
MEEIIKNFNGILIVSGFIILYFTIKNLLPSYFNEKGKNIATKEDISDITKLVEQVKHSFTKETEYLKANLNFLTNIQSSLFSEESSAIIDLNEKYFRWLNFLLDSSLNDVDLFNNEELEAHSKIINNSYRDFLNSETRFNLFVKNHELTKFTTQLKINILESLNHHPFECISALKKNNHEWEKIKKFEPLETQTQKHSQYLENYSSITDEFRKKMLVDYREISPKCSEFQRLCRDHLYQLAKKETE